MSPSTAERLRFLPRLRALTEIVERERIDDRLGAVNATCGAIIDVTAEYIELLTDVEPSDTELVAWAWVIDPNLGMSLRDLASGEMRKVIESYDLGEN